MFHRIVSLILIAAIIACPLWCGVGVCHSAHCCSEESSEPVQDTCCCCCSDEIPEAPPEQDHRCPCDTSKDSECQGICGGAVFDKPITFNFDKDFLLPLLAVESPSLNPLVPCCPCDGDDHLSLIAINYGRALRTLHLSFLC